MVNRYNDVKHEYYIDDRKLLSVTQLISKYQRPFNAPLVANKIADETRTAEDILCEWDLKRDIANNYGNAIHKAIEGHIKYGIVPTQAHLKLAVDKFVEKFGHISWESEYRVFNAEYELGGTLDLYSPKHRIIADIKTNDTNKKSKNKGRFIEPLNKYKVNNLNKVRLQTKVYETLMGEECKKYVYIWTGEDFIEQELEDIDLCGILKIRKEEIERKKKINEMF